MTSGDPAGDPALQGEARPRERRSEPAPFAHLQTQNAAYYRGVLTAFARARDRFIVHMRPEDVAADIGRPGEADIVAALLTQLAEWGNLRADPDTGRVTTVEDFHRARFLYQLTPAGQAAEEALAVYEKALGRRGALQSVALDDIATNLRGLLELARADAAALDPAKAHMLLLGLADRFRGLADNAQAFMASLRRVIDFADGDVEAFLAYKDRLIDYISRFIADLANRGAEIATLLLRIEEAGVERVLLAVARRDASDALPDVLTGAAGDESASTAGVDAHVAAVAVALEGWRNRWRGLRDWFVSTDTRHPSQARLLRGAALTAITQLVDTVGVLNQRREGRSDRSADFRALARWFAQAPDDASAHQLWRAAFGLTPARHLTVTAETVEAWQHEEPPASTPWAAAPPVRISPQLRRTGSYERRGAPNRVADREAQRRELAVLAAREAEEAAAARARLVTDGPVLLSALGVLDTQAFRLFLGLLGDALSTRRPGQPTVETTSGDGTVLIRLTAVEGAGIVEIDTEDGVLRGPEHIVEIIDLAAPPRPRAPRDSGAGGLAGDALLAGAAR
jgi:uncharacterized protein (TIGR02677 family)